MSAYDEAWELYMDAGWPVVPVYPGTKRPAASGVTGWFGLDMPRSEASRWAGGDYGIAVRMPIGVIAIDVDAYEDKKGAETLTQLESELGPLPETYRNSARYDDPVSGHRFYRVPKDRTFIGDLGTDSGIEILQRHHRIAVVWPTINIKTGTMYRWTLNGEVCAIPRIGFGELAEL